MSNVKAFQADDIYKLELELNEFSKTNKVIATQVFPRGYNDVLWYDALVYFEGNITPESKKTSPTSPETPKNAIKKASDKQKRLLRKALEQGALDIKESEIEGISAQEAFYKIQDLMGKR